MGNFDRERAQRVWQRVQTAQPEMPVVQPAQQLLGWILEEWQTGQRYIALQGQLPSGHSRMLKEMVKEKQAQVACLKGIYRIMTGSQPKVATVAPKIEPAANLLRKCYGSLMRSLAWYDGVSHDPEYGSAYNRLAQQNRTHCQSILTLLGKL